MNICIDCKYCIDFKSCIWVRTLSIKPSGCECSKNGDIIYCPKFEKDLESIKTYKLYKLEESKRKKLMLYQKLLVNNKIDILVQKKMTELDNKISILKKELGITDIKTINKTSLNKNKNIKEINERKLFYYESKKVDLMKERVKYNRDTKMFKLLSKQYYYINNQIKIFKLKLGLIDKNIKIN